MADAVLDLGVSVDSIDSYAVVKVQSGAAWIFGIHTTAAVGAIAPGVHQWR